MVQLRRSHLPGPDVMHGLGFSVAETSAVYTSRCGARPEGSWLHPEVEHVAFSDGQPTCRRRFLARQECAKAGADAVRNTGDIPSFHESKPHILQHWRTTLIFVFVDSYDTVRNFFTHFSSSAAFKTTSSPVCTVRICLNYLENTHSSGKFPGEGAACLFSEMMRPRACTCAWALLQRLWRLSCLLQGRGLACVLLLPLLFPDGHSAVPLSLSEQCLGQGEDDEWL